MSKHTPGPWHAFRPTGGYYEVNALCGNPGDDESVLSPATISKGVNEMANANLIAAAPDMLEALKAIPTWGGNNMSRTVCRMCCRAQSEGCEEGCKFDAIRKAIAKAEGS